MTSPPDIETPFRKLARERLISPLAERFNVGAWNQAFEAIVDPTEDDHRLLRAAFWIGESAQRLYDSRPVRFPGMGPGEATVIGIATLNEQYRVLSANAREAGRLAGANQPIALDYLANVRFENAHGQRMSIGDYLEPFVDALDAWLFDAARSLGPVDISVDARAMIEPLVHFYSMRHILKRLFDKVLYLGQYLDADGVWVPHDRALASLHQAWFARTQAVFDAAAVELFGAWDGLSISQRRALGLTKSVVEATLTGSSMKLKVGRLPYLSGRAPMQPMTRAGFKNSYLAEFLDLPLPLAPALTAALIEDAWWVCADAARALTRAAAALSDGPVTAGEWANAIPRAELIRALVKALGIDSDVARQIITFLIYGEAPRPKRGAAASNDDHGWRGLWAAPLVLLEEHDIVLLSPGVFEHCAPLYRVEAWLEKGGLDDRGLERATRGRGQRGNRFENSYRARLCAALAQNPLFSTSCAAPHGVPKIDGEGGFPEQIDLLIKLDNRLLLGELKFLLTPADPHQWSRHYEKLGDAARQAVRKTASLNIRRDVAARALGIDEAAVTALPITPIIVLNSGYGFSLEIEGCRVIDANFLLSYVQSPDFETGGIMGQRSMLSQEITSLYATEREAAERFDRVIARPPVLVRFLNRVRWDIVDYPAPNDKPFRIDCPFRGDMTSLEREWRTAFLAKKYS